MLNINNIKVRDYIEIRDSAPKWSEGVEYRVSPKTALTDTDNIYYTKIGGIKI